MLLLFLSAIVYSIDKGIVGVLAEPIRRDFAIGDTQMGLLLGLAYSLLSGVLGLFLGHFVDRSHRFRLLAGMHPAVERWQRLPAASRAGLAISSCSACWSGWARRRWRLPPSR